MSENKSESKYEYLDKGFTATIYRLPDTSKVCKSFWEGYRETHFPVEKSCYEIFTSHSPPPTILKYYGVDENEPAGLVLELAEKGDLYHYLWDLRHARNTTPSHALLYRWARQTAEALIFVHKCGIWHCDIHIVNFLLDGELNLKIADFAAASIEGGKPNSYYRHSHQLYLKGQELKEVSVLSEVFAVGSAVFQMVTGREPFAPELKGPEDKVEIARRIRGREFPDVIGLPVLGDVIKKCWNLEFQDMEEVLKAINAESGSGVDGGESQP